MRQFGSVVSVTMKFGKGDLQTYKIAPRRDLVGEYWCENDSETQTALIGMDCTTVYCFSIMVKNKPIQLYSSYPQEPQEIEGVYVVLDKAQLRTLFIPAHNVACIEMAKDHNAIETHG